MKKAVEMTTAELARYIDHSVLKPQFTQDEIIQHTKEAVEFGCATVCINPASLDVASKIVAGTQTGICVVCDFPFGLSTTNSKVMQAEEYCSKYKIADLDIVANYGQLRSGNLDFVTADIKAVSDVCHKYGTQCKVIIETDSLNKQQIIDGTKCAIAAGADFIKSSTGFYTGGETVGGAPEIIQIMMEAAAGKIKVKASGKIRTQEHFFKLIDMGVDRMGIGYTSTPIVLGIK